MTSETRSVRQTLGGLSLIAAPIVLLVAGAIHPAESKDAARQLQIVAEHQGQWYAAHLLFAIGFALFIPAAFAVAARVREGAPALQLTGTSLAVAGSAAMVAFMAVEGLVTWSLAKSPNAAFAADAADRLVHSAGIIGVFSSVGLGVQVGLVVLAVALGRTATAPAWVAWTLGLSGAGLAVGFITGASVVLIVVNLALVVAMVWLGLSDLGVLGRSSNRDALVSPRIAYGVGR